MQCNYKCLADICICGVNSILKEAIKVVQVAFLLFPLSYHLYSKCQDYAIRSN